MTNTNDFTTYSNTELNNYFDLWESCPVLRVTPTYHFNKYKEARLEHYQRHKTNIDNYYIMFYENKQNQKDKTDIDFQDWIKRLNSDLTYRIDN